MIRSGRLTRGSEAEKPGIGRKFGSSCRWNCRANTHKGRRWMGRRPLEGAGKPLQGPEDALRRKIRQSNAKNCGKSIESERFSANHGLRAALSRGPPKTRITPPEQSSRAHAKQFRQVPYAEAARLPRIASLAMRRAPHDPRMTGDACGGRGRRKRQPKRRSGRIPQERVPVRRNEAAASAPLCDFGVIGMTRFGVFASEAKQPRAPEPIPARRITRRLRRQRPETPHDPSVAGTALMRRSRRRPQPELEKAMQKQ